MCLENIISIEKITYGYKLFRLPYTTLLGQFQRMNTPRPEGKWLQAKNFRSGHSITALQTNHYVTYPNGWHVFNTKAGAKKFAKYNPDLVIRKVQIKKILASGYQLFYSSYNKQEKIKVTVCNQIRIIPKEEL